MTKKQKDEMVSVLNEGVCDVILPVLDKIMNKLDVVEGDIKDIKADIDSLNRKHDATQNRLDIHEEVIQKYHPTAFA